MQLWLLKGALLPITTYHLIKTPDNETVMFVMVEILVPTYIVSTLKNAWFRNTPTVEILSWKWLQYQTEDGVDVVAEQVLSMLLTQLNTINSLA